MERMKELTVAIQDEYEGKVIYRTKLYTEEDYVELENELEYVRTIKDSAEKTLKEVREENKKLKSDLSLVIKERDDNIKQNKKLKDNVAWYEKEEDRLREENKKLNELIFDINNQFEAYRKKMIDVEQELKNFLYKD